MTEDPYEAVVLANIAKFGWHVAAIPADSDVPSFAYTIGLMETFAHPEMILFGLALETTHGIFSTMVKEIGNGISFSDPGRYPNTIQDYDVFIQRIDETQHEYYLGYAMWHRRHVGKLGTLNAVQVVWPDGLGTFPWEAGFHEPNRNLQPTLWEPHVE